LFRQLFKFYWPNRTLTKAKLPARLGGGMDV